MNFARRVFFWAGIYGIVVLFPMYFLEAKIGRDFPPPTNHPEQYYAFLGVALAWQLGFLVISRDPRRYRPFMLPAIAEKVLPVSSVLWLYQSGRVNGAAVAPFLADIVLGVLFLVSYLRTSESANAASP